MKFFTMLLLILLSSELNAQVSGIIFEETINDGKKQKEGVPGVRVYWQNHDAQVASDNQGKFKIEAPGVLPDFLIFSYVGYPNDTVKITRAPVNNIQVVYKEGQELDGLTVKGKTSYISFVDPRNVRTISQKHLHTAACCNLSESFERDATVDVSFSDAVSGTKKILMLGLDGVYTQMLSENIPTMRGLSAPYGLTFVPGPWIQSIMITKGTGSVANGYESITGQINIEFIKPDDSPKLFVNGYINNNLRSEFNAYTATKVNDHWSTMFYVNGNLLQNRVDRNNDSFIDDPLTKQINVFHRWKYQKGNKMTQFGVKALIDDRSGGQTNFNYANDYNTTNAYGFGAISTQIEAFAKGGMPLKKEATSLAFLSSYRYHDQDSYYGLRDYKGTQNSGYLNLVYASYLGNTNHTYKAGLGGTMDLYEQTFVDSSFSRNEYVPGAFFEYTYKNLETFTAVLGMRGDYHSIFGFQYSPRAHLKWHPNEHTVLRVAGGKGFRSPNVIIENAAVFASSRVLDVRNGFGIEEAWNYGISWSEDFTLFKRDATFIMDFFRTDFTNQMIVDMETAGLVSIYNLEGQSFSNAFQVDLITEPLTGLTLSLAYKYTDVKMQYDSGLETKPYVPIHRAMANLDYKTPNKKWDFSFTSNYYGLSRVPSTTGNTTDNQRANSSTPYFILHGQITKHFKRFDIYLGSENLTNFIQKRAIIAPNDPFSEEFDASMIWGPMNGRIVYAGFRFKIK